MLCACWHCLRILANDEGLGLLVCLLEVVVDNNLVVGCLGALCELHLDLSLVEPLKDVFLLVRSAAPEALLEDVHAGRREEQEPWAGEGRVVCDLLDALAKWSVSCLVTLGGLCSRYLHLNV